MPESFSVKLALRQLLRRVSRNRVLIKRLPADLHGGVVYCSPEALLSTWKPGWQSEQAQGLLNWARRYVQPGMCVWDLGANQGIFSLAAAAIAGSNGSIVAFEPDLFLVDLIRRSLATGTHRGATVQILPMAVGASAAIAEFQIARTDRALNHLSSAKGNPQAGDARELLLVNCQSLDWLMTQLPRPDLLKIDVEGAELAVLRAGCEFLRTVRPVMIVETAPEHATEVGELLSEANYSMFEVGGNLDRPLPMPAWNTLVWPSERLDELAELGAEERS